MTQSQKINNPFVSWALRYIGRVSNWIKCILVEIRIDPAGILYTLEYFRQKLTTYIFPLSDLWHFQFIMVDGVYRTRSLGTAAAGLPDQYADGKAAKLWEIYVGDTGTRTEYYKTFLLNLLHENKCKSVLDVACGTGLVQWNLWNIQCQTY